jgi:hypothetical protein
MTLGDYIDMVNALREDNISIGTSLKFKNVSECNFSFFVSQFILSGVLGYVGGRYILGPFRKMPAAGKSLFPIAMSIFFIDMH